MLGPDSCAHVNRLACCWDPTLILYPLHCFSRRSCSSATLSTLCTDAHLSLRPVLLLPLRSALALRYRPFDIRLRTSILRWPTHANPAASHLVPECASSFNCHLSWARHRIDAEKPSAGIAACSLPSSLIGASCKQAFISSALPIKLLFICLFPSACIYILPNLACCPTRSTRSPPVPFQRFQSSQRQQRQGVGNPFNHCCPPVPESRRSIHRPAAAAPLPNNRLGPFRSSLGRPSARAINTDTIELISP